MGDVRVSVTITIKDSRWVTVSQGNKGVVQVQASSANMFYTQEDALTLGKVITAMASGYEFPLGQPDPSKDSHSAFDEASG
jgi:hypothetical protein